MPSGNDPASNPVEVAWNPVALNFYQSCDIKTFWNYPAEQLSKLVRQTAANTPILQHATKARIL